MRESLSEVSLSLFLFSRTAKTSFILARGRTDCSFVLQIRIQKWIQSLPAYFPATARIRGPSVSRLCLFPRDTSQRDNGSFPFLGDVDETTAMNGNPFGDVNVKFSIQP